MKALIPLLSVFQSKSYRIVYDVIVIISLKINLFSP